jgi:hypothetical protein
MWTTIKSLDPRTVLAVLRRPSAVAKPRPKAEPACLTSRADSTGTILSYDNLR